jgi:hypothetical protein
LLDAQRWRRGVHHVPHERGSVVVDAVQQAVAAMAVGRRCTEPQYGPGQSTAPASTPRKPEPESSASQSVPQTEQLQTEHRSGRGVSPMKSLMRSRGAAYRVAGPSRGAGPITGD